MKELIFLSIFFLVFLAVAGFLLNDYHFLDQEPMPDICVSGIVPGPSAMATVNNEPVREGDVVAGAKVERIFDNYVLLRSGVRLMTRRVGQSCRYGAEPVYNTEGLVLCGKAKKHFDRAEAQYRKQKTPLAYIDFKKAVHYADLALSYPIREKKKDMSLIMRQSRISMRELKHEAEQLEKTPYPLFKGPREAIQWVNAHIAYKKDFEAHMRTDYWQTPWETLTMETGDCEDYSFLIQALLKNLNIESTVVSVEYDDPHGKGPTSHAMGVYPEDNPQWGFTPYKLVALKKGLLGYVASRYPGWRKIYILDAQRGIYPHVFERSQEEMPPEVQHDKMLTQLLGLGPSSGRRPEPGARRGFGK